MNIVTIENPHDPRLADYMGLKDIDTARSGFFIAESLEVVRRLLRTRHVVRSLLVAPTVLDKLAPDLEATDHTVYVANLDTLSKVAGFALHRGVVAAADRLPPPDLVDLLRDGNVVAILQGINDHENLGAIFRTGQALGIDAVLMDPTCADPYYRRSVRVSMGAVLTLPFARIADWPAGLGKLKDLGWHLVALTPERTATAIEDVEPRSKTALLFGAESPGLSADVKAVADVHVRIPINASTDSLNVGHAAAIAFHHFARPRNSLTH